MLRVALEAQPVDQVVAVEADEAAMEAVYDKQHSMAEFTDPKEYKSYEDLQKRLNLVLGEQAPRPTMAQAATLDDEIPYNNVNKVSDAPEIPTAESTSIASKDDDVDDTMSYFAKLANGDD